MMKKINELDLRSPQGNPNNMDWVIFNQNNHNMEVELESESVDLIITSPPYDQMREYHQDESDDETLWNWENFKISAEQCYKVLKDGGIIAWVVNDQYIKGGRTGSSMRQALFFMDVLGLKLHDHIIWEKPSFSMPSSNRNHQVWENVFVFKKESAKHTFNPILDRIVSSKNLGQSTTRLSDGSMKKTSQNKQNNIGKKSGRFNVWKIKTSNNELPCKKIPHPATFSYQLAQDLIYSYSNEGDVVLDPFMGYGTSAIAAASLNRRFIGFELSQEYADLAENRIIRWYNKYKELLNSSFKGNCQVEDRDALNYADFKIGTIE